MPEEVVRRIVDTILFRHTKTAWSVLGEQFATDLASGVFFSGNTPDPEALTRCEIAAWIWKEYGPPGVPYQTEVKGA